MSTAQKRTRKEPSQRRAEIIDAACALADEIGLDRLTGRDVAARVGVTSGLLHHYFPHVDDVIVEAFRWVVTADTHRLGDGLDGLRPLDALSEFLRRSLSPDREPALTMWMSAWVAAPRRQKLAHEVEHQMKDGIHLLARLLERGVEAGDFRVSDNERTAWRILVMLDGAAVQRTIRFRAHPIDDLTELVSQVAERELGLPPGALLSRADEAVELTDASTPAAHAGRQRPAGQRHG